MAIKYISIFRKTALNIILIIAFLSSASIITLSFVSDMQFNRAKLLEENFFWKKAEEKYKLAMMLEALNAKYPAELGKFLVRQGIYHKNEISQIKMIEKLYKRALELNPAFAEYALRLGTTQIERGEKKISDAFDNFEKALKGDPNNFNISYSVGYSGVSAWNSLNKVQKVLVLDKLKDSLKRRPGYYEYIYDAAWKGANDFNLLQEITPPSFLANKNLYDFVLKRKELYLVRKKQKEITDFYLKEEDPEGFWKIKEEKTERIRKIKEEKSGQRSATHTVSREDWKGRSRDGEHVYEDGKMFWNGTLDARLEIPEGEAVISIKAKGSPANDIWPYMIVELDGKEIDEIFVDSPEWKEYVFKINTYAGVHVLSITFENDGGNWERKQDRNLYIRDAQVVRGKE